eukprot:snap_masked-scaffold_19-processed-gene-1.42-mRNA-1 protein AED:0.01 eAED:0.01 QI:0/-1/0/1/-1/1/1/0/235
MFTGIIEEIGEIYSFTESSDLTLWNGEKSKGYILILQFLPNSIILSKETELGDSIAVNGICLTVTEFNLEQKKVSFGVAPETINRTTFKKPPLKGDKVNIERAALISSRNSGHNVQGHVDCTATIVKKVVDGDSVRYSLKVDEAKNIFSIVEKGYVAIDGTSLTVTFVDYSSKTFGFMLVNYTQKKVIISKKEVDDKVNLEVDIIGKYVSSTLETFTKRIDSLEARLQKLEVANQ